MPFSVMWLFLVATAAGSPQRDGGELGGHRRLSSSPSTPPAPTPPPPAPPVTPAPPLSPDEILIVSASDLQTKLSTLDANSAPIELVLAQGAVLDMASVTTTIVSDVTIRASHGNSKPRFITPSTSPSTSPSASPSVSPSVSPSLSPTSPSTSPTTSPSASPQSSPTLSPTSPTTSPSGTPSTSPSGTPSTSPSGTPSATPTSPSASPSVSPSVSPSLSPTSPSVSPTLSPTSPTASPSGTPSAAPNKLTLAVKAGAGKCRQDGFQKFDSNGVLPPNWKGFNILQGGDEVPFAGCTDASTVLEDCEQHCIDTSCDCFTVAPSGDGQCSDPSYPHANATNANTTDFSANCYVYYGGTYKAGNDPPSTYLNPFTGHTGPGSDKMVSYIFQDAPSTSPTTTSPTSSPVDTGRRLADELQPTIKSDQTQLFIVGTGGTLKLQGVHLTTQGKVPAESGAAVHVTGGGSATLDGVTISNSGAVNGGAVGCWGSGSELVLNSCDIHDCEAEQVGGAAYVDQGDLTISDCRISRCTAAAGGAVGNGGMLDGSGDSSYLGDGTLLMQGSVVKDCTASLLGGALFLSGNLGLANSIWDPSQAGELVLSSQNDCNVILQRTVSELEVGVYDALNTNCGGMSQTATACACMSGAGATSTAVITDTNFINNQAARWGGSLFVAGVLTATRMTVEGRGDPSDPESEVGGGMFSMSQDTTLTDCLFTGLHAWGSGGGIEFSVAAKATVVNTNFYNCFSYYHGGGISADQGCTIEMISGKFTRCSAEARGGGFAAKRGGTINMNMTVIESCFAAGGGGGAVSDGGIVNAAAIQGRLNYAVYSKLFCINEIGGFAMVHNGGELHISDNSLISENRAAVAAGSVWLGGEDRDGTLLTFRDSTMDYGLSAWGGHIQVRRGLALVERSKLTRGGGTNFTGLSEKRGGKENPFWGFSRKWNDPCNQLLEARLSGDAGTAGIISADGVRAEVIVRDSELTESAMMSGAGLEINGKAKVTMERCNMHRLNACDQGGAWRIKSGSVIKIRNSTASDCAVGTFGGFVSIEGADIELSRTVLTRMRSGIVGKGKTYFDDFDFVPTEGEVGLQTAGGAAISSTVAGGKLTTRNLTIMDSYSEFDAGILIRHTVEVDFAGLTLHPPPCDKPWRPPMLVLTDMGVAETVTKFDAIRGLTYVIPDCLRTVPKGQTWPPDCKVGKESSFLNLFDGQKKLPSYGTAFVDAATNETTYGKTEDLICLPEGTELTNHDLSMVVIGNPVNGYDIVGIPPQRLTHPMVSENESPTTTTYYKTDDSGAVTAEVDYYMEPAGTPLLPLCSQQIPGAEPLCGPDAICTDVPTIANAKMLSQGGSKGGPNPEYSYSETGQSCLNTDDKGKYPDTACVTQLFGSSNNGTLGALLANPSYWIRVAGTIEKYAPTTPHCSCEFPNTPQISSTTPVEAAPYTLGCATPHRIAGVGIAALTVNSVVLDLDKPDTASRTLTLRPGGTAMRDASWTVDPATVPPWLVLDQLSGVFGSTRVEAPLFTMTAYTSMLPERNDPYVAQLLIRTDTDIDRNFTVPVLLLVNTFDNVSTSTFGKVQSEMNCSVPAHQVGVLTNDNGCNNQCYSAYSSRLYSNDDECDDGGPNSDYGLCPIGSDCQDCGDVRMPGIAGLPGRRIFGLAANVEGIVDEELVLPFTACDLDDLPVAETAPDGRKFRVNAVSSPGDPTITDPNVDQSVPVDMLYSAFGVYDIIIDPPRVGDYALEVELEDTPGSWVKVLGGRMEFTAKCDRGKAVLPNGGCACPKGYGSLPNGECELCPGGSAKTIVGDISCLTCPAGTMAPGQGSVECTPCPEGTFSVSIGSTQCLLCAEGISAVLGSSKCEVCAAGFFSNAEADKLQDNTTSAADFCEVCPEAGICPFATTVQNMFTRQGYYRLTDQTYQFYKCDMDKDDLSPCAGGPEAGPSSCLTGYRGPKCQVCVEDRHYYSKSECNKCPPPEDAAMTLLGIIVAVTFVCYCLYLFTAKPHPKLKPASDRFKAVLQAIHNLGPSKVKTAVTFYQIINSLDKSFDLAPIATDFKFIRGFSAWLDFDWSELFYPTGCFSSGYSTRLLIIAFVPMAAMVVAPIILFLFVFLNTLCCGKESASIDSDITSIISRANASKRLSMRASQDGSSRQESGPRKSLARSLSTKIDASRTSISEAMASEKVSTAKSKLIEALPMVLLVVFVMLPAIGRAIFSAWDCMPYASGPDTETFFLRVDESVECDTQAHQNIINLAVILVIIWPIGAQVLFFYVLFINRKVLRADRLNALAKSTKFLTGGYKPHVFFWETIELFRRLAVSGFVVLIPYQYIYWRIIFALFVSMPIFAATALILPFRRLEDNYLSLANQALLITAFIICMLIRIVNEEMITAAQKTAIVGYSGAEGLFLTLIGIILLFIVLLLCTYCYKVYGEYLRLVSRRSGDDANAQAGTMFAIAAAFSFMGLVGGGLIAGFAGAAIGAFSFIIIGVAVGSLSWKHCVRNADNLWKLLGINHSQKAAAAQEEASAAAAVKAKMAPESQTVSHSA